MVENNSTESAEFILKISFKHISLINQILQLMLILHITVSGLFNTIISLNKFINLNKYNLNYIRINICVIYT